MGHPSVSFTVPSLGDLLVRELKLAGLEIDLDDHQSSENSPEYYERLAIRVEERHGADVPGPSSFVLRGQPKRRRRRRYSEVPPAVRCVLLARALIKVCALERERALFQGAAEIGPMHSEMNDLYKRRREGLTTEINKLDALGTAPFRDKEWNERLVQLKVRLAANLQSTPLPVESGETLPIKPPAKFSREFWNKIIELLAETGLTQKQLAPVLYDTVGSKPGLVENRLGQKVFRARKRRAF
jgi:hypothetical protein